MATSPQSTHQNHQKILQKKDLLELIELRNHLLQIGRLYLRKREALNMLVISGATIDQALTVQELLEMILCD